MIGRRTIDVKEVPLAEVKEILEMPSDIEAGFEQTKTLDYSKKVAKLEKDKAYELIDELMAAVAKVNRAKAVKLADLMPKTAEEIAPLFAKETFALTEDETAKIIEIVGKYAKA
jgi:DNA-directed RNA polymerase subunit F